jgi:iron only hydrogenase large subunit-like protein
MFGAVTKTWYAEKMNLDPKNIVVVSIMPCTAKKFECGREDQSASGYPDADYSVPFLQMILHGSVDYTTTAVNLSGDFRTEVLKAIENGSGLYFEIAYRNSEILKESSQTDKYSVDYKIWKNQITECYSQVEQAIGDLSNQRIVDFKQVADGVSKTVYSSGTVIYVNYNDEDVNAEGVTVPKYSYIRIEKGE